MDDDAWGLNIASQYAPGGAPPATWNWTPTDNAPTSPTTSDPPQVPKQSLRIPTPRSSSFFNASWSCNSSLTGLDQSTFHGTCADEMAVKQAVGGAYDAITSKGAQRTLLYTVLLTAASVVLYGSAIFAYLLFYHNYLPDQVRTVPVHLQYEPSFHRYPYAIASMDGVNLKQLQDYDVTVALTLPRSPANLERPNFMVELLLMQPNGVARDLVMPPKPEAFLKDNTASFASFRPAVIPYTHPVVSQASRLLFLAYHIFFPFAEKTTLTVPMAEKLFFKRDQTLPSSLYLEIHTDMTLQTYSTAVTFVARLQGLRYLMYHWWITSFLVFTTMFWMVEVLFMVLAFGGLASIFVSSKGEQETGDDVKKESPTDTLSVKQEGEGDDTPLTRKNAFAILPLSSDRPPHSTSNPTLDDETGMYDEVEDDNVKDTAAKQAETTTGRGRESGTEGLTRRRLSSRS